ncbi:LysR family transcriptional regulator [Actinoallomurus sp. NPDC050550]|uniref:LysR family transcriptional regulator n=1 Tax=Actinoallomurus sp. NPDC050550 TaxID=3154937 RepID=UPI0033F15C27
MISSRQLEYFQAVARELHFTRAARELRIAQPALSQQIRKLERQLGVVLFERDNHRVALTEAGSALLERADRILADIGAVEDEMRGWGGGTRGRIRLGVARGLIAGMSRLLAEFCAAYPGVEMRFREMTTGEMVEGLLAGRLDVATVAEVPRNEPRLATHSLGEEPLVLIVAPAPSPGHVTPAVSPDAASPGAVSPGAAFAPGDRARVAGLGDLDLVTYPPGSVVREVVAGALADAGISGRFRFETRDYGTARSLVSVGLAAAVLPRSVATEPGPPVRVIDLEPVLTWRPSLAWSAVRVSPPALKVFVDFVAEHGDILGLSPRG